MPVFHVTDGRDPAAPAVDANAKTPTKADSLPYSPAVRGLAVRIDDVFLGWYCNPAIFLRLENRGTSPIRLAAMSSEDGSGLFVALQVRGRQWQQRIVLSPRTAIETPRQIAPLEVPARTLLPGESQIIMIEYDVQQWLEAGADVQMQLSIPPNGDRSAWQGQIATPWYPLQLRHDAFAKIYGKLDAPSYLPPLASNKKLAMYPTSGGTPLSGPGTRYDFGLGGPRIGKAVYPRAARSNDAPLVEVVCCQVHPSTLYDLPDEGNVAWDYLLDKYSRPSTVAAIERLLQSETRRPERIMLAREAAVRGGRQGRLAFGEYLRSLTATADHCSGQLHHLRQLLGAAKESSPDTQAWLATELAAMIDAAPSALNEDQQLAFVGRKLTLLEDDSYASLLEGANNSTIGRLARLVRSPLVSDSEKEWFDRIEPEFSWRCAIWRALGENGKAMAIATVLSELETRVERAERHWLDALDLTNADTTALIHAAIATRTDGARHVVRRILKRLDELDRAGPSRRPPSLGVWLYEKIEPWLKECGWDDVHRQVKGIGAYVKYEMAASRSPSITGTDDSTRAEQVAAALIHRVASESPRSAVDLARLLSDPRIRDTFQQMHLLNRVVALNDPACAPHLLQVVRDVRADKCGWITTIRAMEGLAKYPTRETIAGLIAILDLRAEEWHGNRAEVCDTLRTLTGERWGDYPSDWQAWWREEGIRDPRWTD